MPQDAALEPAIIGGGLALLVAGLLLCFAGFRALRVAAVGVGFGFGALVAGALGAGVVLTLIIGVAVGVGALALANLLVGWGLFVVGSLSGGVIAASWFRTYSLISWNPTVVVIAVLVVAVICGIGATRAQGVVLMAVTALAGAGLILRGLTALDPSFFGFLHDPQTAGANLIVALIWLAVAAAGWGIQRRRRSDRRASRQPAP